MVIEKKYFDRIAPADQAIVREVMEQVYLGFEQQGNEDNEKAHKALLDDGMKSVTPNHSQVQEWHGAVEASNHELAAEGVIDADLLSEIECYVAAYRAGNPEKDCTQWAAPPQY